MQTESTETTKKVSKSGLIFNNPDAETLFKSTAFVSPSTYFSPKDKVSNMTWSSKIPCNENKAIITVQKSDDFGCIVRLNYDKIFADEHVITGADPSNFSNIDRAVYDAVVTIIVAGNNVFNNTDI